MRHVQLIYIDCFDVRWGYYKKAACKHIQNLQAEQGELLCL